MADKTIRRVIILCSALATGSTATGCAGADEDSLVLQLSGEQPEKADGAKAATELAKRFKATAALVNERWAVTRRVSTPDRRGEAVPVERTAAVAMLNSVSPVPSAGKDASVSRSKNSITVSWNVAAGDGYAWTLTVTPKECQVIRSTHYDGDWLLEDYLFTPPAPLPNLNSLPGS
jgi:hypothetical protein